MGMLQLHNPTHPSTLLQRANQMRLTGTLCDVIITVDGQEFPAHRTVLACTSKMFEILFHRSSLRYALDFLSPKTFQQILEYAYTASLQATAEDLDDLLYAAEILEIEFLEEQCLKVLETIQAEEREDVPVRNKTSGDHSHTRLWRHMMSKKHSVPDGPPRAPPSALHHLAFYHMTERSPPRPESGPELDADTDMESCQQPGADASSLDPPRHIKSETMQVDDPDGWTPTGEGSCVSDRPRDEDPGTPLRNSVITSTRQLHTGPEDGAHVTGHPLDCLPGIAEKHLASVFSVPPDHREEGLTPVSLSAAPSMGIPLDPRAYGSLLHQGLLHRELLSRLGQFAAGMRHQGAQPPDPQCCGQCGLQLHGKQAMEQHR